MAKNKIRRPVNIHSVYADLRNVKGDKVRTYGIRDILTRSTIIKKQQVIHVNHLYDDTPDIEKLVRYMEDIDYRGGIDYKEEGAVDRNHPCNNPNQPRTSQKVNHSQKQYQHRQN